MGDLDQTQLGGVGPYHGLEGVTAGWFIDGENGHRQAKGRVSLSISSVFEFHFGKIIPAGRVKGWCQKLSTRSLSNNYLDRS